MKDRALILIFLFLISLQTVCGESHTGEVNLQLSEDAPDWSLLDAHTGGVSAGISIDGFQYKGVADAGIPNTLVFRDASMSKEAAYSWADIPQNVGGSFALYDNGVFAGTGGISIHRVNDVDVGRVDIWYMFDDTDFVANSSETTMDVTLYASPINEYYVQFNVDYWGNPYTTQNVYMRLKYSTSYSGTHASWSAGGSSYVEYDYYGHFINEYNITLWGATASTVITRDGLGQQLSSSRLKLTTNTGSTVYLPSSYSTINSTHYHDNGSYYYYLDVENYGDVLIHDGIGSGADHDGVVTLNQTFYTDPENIGMEWDITGFDSESYTYMIQMTATLDGDVDGNFWEAVGSWNISTYVSSASGAAVFDLSSEWYDEIPIWIRGELWAKEKATGVSTRFDLTPAVIYHEKTYSEQTGTIVFNKTFFIEYEDIEVEWDLDDYDADQYIYEIQITTSVSGVFSQDSWVADGNWNVTPFISSASGTALFDFYSDGYDLPIWVQGELWAQHKATGAWTIVDRTPGVGYLQSSDFGVGSIWTDKSNYNVTELVEISYTTNVAENFIFVEEPNSYWVTYDMPVGTYSFFYELSTSAVGNTTIYLSENDVRVDQVTILVSSESGDDAYAAWMADYYYEGEMAHFYYYSSNTSAQITVYDGADVVVFGPATTQLGYHNGIVNTVNTNPGTFLLSLYHNGTYYNDTMIFESVDSWVRFDSSKYYVGDTINIEYYLSDPTQQISMWDANQKKVVRFTTNYGLVSGSMQTLPYTLSEYNEYSHDIPGRLASGELTLGFWKIFIEDKNGVFVGDSWDEAYVCNATGDDPVGVSDDMINIFFSPEGVFMLFTACLTMMGLAVVKHPAGGGAGAVVGVGFGVYFKVLPEWMLILTVITLVVLAGVSIAVYLKGK